MRLRKLESILTRLRIKLMRALFEQPRRGVSKAIRTQLNAQTGKTTSTHTVIKNAQKRLAKILAKTAYRNSLVRFTATSKNSNPRAKLSLPAQTINKTPICGIHSGGNKTATRCYPRFIMARFNRSQ